MNAIDSCIQLYLARRARLAHPAGSFDSGGRWYPADSEKRACCDSIRSPSRRWPWSLMRHCRSLEHCARLYALEPETVRARYLQLKRAGKLPSTEGEDNDSE